jgi:glyoxylase-like metal-dependent hydrolase (beta-lactamase superfamily II)
MSAIEVASGVRAIDLWDRGRAEHTSGYLISAPRLALVDTGAARSVPLWLNAFAEIGIAPSEIAYVIVTHIHLDHAGGAGALLRHLPAAQVVVHRHGARHLADPSRLIAGARQVFGDHLEEYFGLPEAVPESRLLVPDPERGVDLGGGHRLRFFDAPGHARHQHMVLDEASGYLFSGDELGGRYVKVAPDYVIPDTAPNQFDPEAMLRSARLACSLRPEALLFAHFARYPRDCETLRQRLEEQVTAFVALGRADAGPVAWEGVHARLVEHVQRDLAAQGVAWTPAIQAELAEHLEVSSQGILDYHQRRRQQAR